MKPYVKTLSIAMLSLAASAGIAATAFAHSGRGENGPINDLDISHDQKKEIRQAIKDNDYQTWKSLMEQYGADVEIMSEEEFTQMREMRESNFHARHHHEGKKPHHPSPEVREAIDQGDYTAFKAAESENEGPLSEITEEDFNKLVESHRLREEGNHEEAKELKKEIFEKYRPDDHENPEDTENHDDQEDDTDNQDVTS